MQNGPVLRDIDFLAAEHSVDPPSQVGLFGEAKEQAEGFAGDAIFRIIQEDARGFGSQFLAAGGIAGKQIVQVHPANSLKVILECPPGFTLRQRFHFGDHRACAVLSSALLLAITSIRLFQDCTNDLAPSV